MEINISDYQKISHKIAWQFDNYTKFIDCDHDDLFQVSLLAFYKSSLTFDPSRGLKFITCASFIAEQQLIQYTKKLTCKMRTADISSLDAVISEDGSDWYNINVDEKSDQPFISIEFKDFIDRLMPKLTPTKQKILKFLIETGIYSQSEIGRHFGISQSYVGRVIKSLRPKLAELRM